MRDRTGIKDSIISVLLKCLSLKFTISVRVFTIPNFSWSFEQRLQFRNQILAANQLKKDHLVSRLQLAACNTKHLELKCLDIVSHGLV